MVKEKYGSVSRFMKRLTSIQATQFRKLEQAKDKKLSDLLNSR